MAEGQDLIFRPLKETAGVSRASGRGGHSGRSSRQRRGRLPAAAPGGGARFKDRAAAALRTSGGPGAQRASEDLNHPHGRGRDGVPGAGGVLFARRGRQPRPRDAAPGGAGHGRDRAAQGAGRAGGRRCSTG